jgi:apolipoprotein N-acyltransferase
VAVEELRASGELGFPWFQAGYTQHAYGTLIQMASLGSVSFVTAWVALLNVLIWRTLGGGTREARGASGTPRALPAAGAALALLLPWAWGHQVLRAAPGPGEHAVALVQGDIAGEIKWSGQHQQAILDTFLALSARAVADAPEPILVIWPETATGSYLRKQPEQAVAVLRFARDRGVPVFSGFADYRLDERGRPLAQNAAGRFGPDGESREVYAKRHLVPFGERMPFQWLVPALGRIELGQAEWEAGSRSVLFASPAGPFACLICFEAIFPSLARDDVRGGARWLVNITNDEWFGNSAALYQHAAMAVFRAVENHVPLARCANTGLTILVDANGRVTRRLPVFTPATLVARLGRPGPATWYTRLGDWPGWLAVAAALVLALRRRPR